MEETSGLEPEERKEVLKKVERGIIGSRKVREEVMQVKLKKELKKEFEVEIPVELKKVSFIGNFIRNDMEFSYE